MKKTLIVLASLLALAIGATAQQQLSFAQLPLVSSPAQMPIGYGQLTWSNFYYVDPFLWSGAGPGFELGTQGTDVAFVSSQNCRVNGSSNICDATISDSAGFELVSASVAGGYGPASVVAMAYSNGNYIGSMNFMVGTSQETINFPATWGIITELQLQVTSQQTDDLVLYNLSFYNIVQDPPSPAPVQDPPPPGE